MALARQQFRGRKKRPRHAKGVLLLTIEEERRQTVQEVKRGEAARPPKLNINAWVYDGEREVAGRKTGRENSNS